MDKNRPLCIARRAEGRCKTVVQCRSSQLNLLDGAEQEHTSTSTTGKTAPTFTLKRPTGLTPTPQGQPSDKAEKRRGRKSNEF
jgi:hypothetical protein